jgi:Protein of unknown function (DUF2934)
MAKRDAGTDIQREADPELSDRREAAGFTHQEPDPVEIAREAYLIYLANGLRDGRDQEDWFEAERLLISRARARKEDATVQQDTTHPQQQRDKSPASQIV